MDSKARVLLVDDDVVFLKSTQDLLVELGYSVEAATGSEAACGRLAECAVDVVVMDRRMANNEELEFAEFLSVSEDAPPVIVLTAFPSYESAIRALNLRIHAYLVKPVSADELTERIDEVAAQREAVGAIGKARRALSDVNLDLGRLSHVIRQIPNSASHAGSRVRFERDEYEEYPNVDPALELLTKRERELTLELLAGYRVRTIARRLNISQHTVRRHLKNIFLKLEVSSQAELVEKLKPTGPGESALGDPRREGLRSWPGERPDRKALP